MRAGSGWNAQCRSYVAPSVIHFRSTASSASETVLPDSGGGIGSFAARRRRMTSLRSGAPGTTGARPSMRTVAPSKVSRRNLSEPCFLRPSASGPWQEKHFSERIGSTSRLNRSSPAGATPPAATSAAATRPRA